MDWLLDLMGYIRNLAYKSTPIQNVDLKEVCALKTTSSFQEKGFFLTKISIHILSQQYILFPMF